MRKHYSPTGWAFRSRREAAMIAAEELAHSVGTAAAVGALEVSRATLYWRRRPPRLAELRER